IQSFVFSSFISSCSLIASTSFLGIYHLLLCLKALEKVPFIIKDLTRWIGMFKNFAVLLMSIQSFVFLSFISSCSLIASTSFLGIYHLLLCLKALEKVPFLIKD